MSKIYDLYSPDQRKIDNLKRRIRGYEKMKVDISSQNRKLHKENKELKEENQKYKEVIDRLKSIVNDNNVSITRLELGLGILNIKNNLLVILNEVDK